MSLEYLVASELKKELKKDFIQVILTMAYNLKKEKQYIYYFKWAYSGGKSSLMLREHSTKSCFLKALLRLILRADVWLYTFLGRGHKDFLKCLQIPFSNLISTVLGTAAPSSFKYMTYSYQIRKPLYAACGNFVVFSFTHTSYKII